MGCISFPKQAFDKHARPGVKSIALLEATPPAALAVANLRGVGSGFGLIGASIDSAEQERKTNDFNSVVEQERREFGPRMQDALKLGLERNGYSVTVLTGEHPVKDGEDDQDADYSAIATPADSRRHTAGQYQQQIEKEERLAEADLASRTAPERAP